MPDLQNDSGSSNTDNITNDATPIFTGSAETGSVVRIFDGAGNVGTGSAPGGSYSVQTSALSNGPRAISATATDIAGNASASSAVLTVTIDTIAPVVAVTSPTNSASFDFGEEISISGTRSDTNRPVQVTVWRTSVGGTVAFSESIAPGASMWASSGNLYSFGTYFARATQTDVAGNIGTSNTNQFTVTAV